MFKDNKDFYPTPKVLFRQLMSNERFLGGKILEPSAGKGDMIKHIKEMMNRRTDYDIDAIENDDRLVSILVQNDINVVWDDFLTYQTYKEYDHIIMNPPFSNGVYHALKAIDLAERQISSCNIHMILNKETLNNAFNNKRQELLSKLEKYGANIRYVKDSFLNAERKTDVEVALINVNISPSYNAKTIYDSIPFDRMNDNAKDLTTALSTHVESSKVQARLNDIDRLVLEYEKACEVATQAYKSIQKKQSFYSYISKVNSHDGISSDLSSIVPNMKYFHAEHLNYELDNLRRGYWELILDTRDFSELLTNESREKLNRQLSGVYEVEINYTNIQTMLMALQQNQTNILVDSIVSIFKRITQHHMNEYSSNVHYYNGWKTNDAYKINHKIIVPISRGGFEPMWDFKEEYNRINMRTRDFIDDLIKALQLIDSSVTSDFKSINKQEFENEWIRFKMFIKGTVHIWFKDQKLLDKLNYIAGQHFNWIPSDDEQEQDKKAREFVAKEFGDIGKVKLIAV